MSRDVAAVVSVVFATVSVDLDRVAHVVVVVDNLAIRWGEYYDFGYNYDRLLRPWLLSMTTTTVLALVCSFGRSFVCLFVFALTMMNEILPTAATLCIRVVLFPGGFRDCS